MESAKITKLNCSEMGALYEALADIFTGTCVNITSHACNENDPFHSPNEWTVSASWNISLSPNEARDVAKTMIEASNIADYLNSLHIVFTFDPDEEVERLIKNPHGRNPREVILAMKIRFMDAIMNRKEALS